MEKQLQEDIIEWDVINWSRALTYWEKQVDLNKQQECLELGARNGGLSLWLALKGNRVVCSDLDPTEEKASGLHTKYKCRHLVSYQAIDATNIPYQDHFDVAVFKSVLGGIGRYGNSDLNKKAIDEIHKALKPGGVLLFAENIEASFLHKLLRKYFSEWGNYWHYLKIGDVEHAFSSFRNVRYITVGFLAAFGRNERQRRLLGRLDRLVEKLVPKSKRYILIGIAEK